MALNLQVDQAIATVAQPVKDQGGTASPLTLSTTAVGIGTASPEALLHIAGDLQLEKSGSPKLVVYSRGNGTQKYSIRATNDRDPSAAGRRFVIRNESQGRDEIILDNGGNTWMGGDLQLEKSGSPKVVIYSRGNGTQKYSIRATNDVDPAGGRRLVIRNESQGRDEIVIDSNGSMSVAGDILLTGADCAEHFAVEEESVYEPGTVMVISDKERLCHCTEPYDKRVAGVISGAVDCKPGIVLGSTPAEAIALPLALTGKVFCKVDAGYAPIDVGDALTSSPTPGHAMKAEDPVKSSGATIGKALRPLAGSSGLIPILITLQ